MCKFSGGINYDQSWRLSKNGFCEWINTFRSFDDPYVSIHDRIHLINVPQGSFGLGTKDGFPVFLPPGRHLIDSPNFKLQMKNNEREKGPILNCKEKVEAETLKKRAAIAEEEIVQAQMKAKEFEVKKQAEMGKLQAQGTADAAKIVAEGQVNALKVYDGNEFAQRIKEIQTAGASLPSSAQIIVGNIGQLPMMLSGGPQGYPGRVINANPESSGSISLKPGSNNSNGEGK